MADETLPIIPPTPSKDEFTTVRQSDANTGQNALSIRCPGCHEPMRVAVDTRLTDLICPICGTYFSLVDQNQGTRIAPSLSTMGRFELIERLGVGGFGSVWKARDKELDRTVAVKIPRQGVMSPDEQEFFFREARAAAQLRHPSIVSVHEVGRDGDSVYIVSDFVRGVTLGDWLTSQQLTSREAADLCAKIADALHHAHEQGVVHRDLKPANIMIDGHGEPHLMDFGLARRDVGEVTVTMDGQVLGTPAYMSPEQAAGEAHKADRRSDVYSLAVILFQLLTGELPFRGNARMLVHQVIHDEPPSPRKLNANVARDLETITLKCLEKDPERRYGSADELSAELRRFLSGEAIHARPAGVFERTSRWGRKNRTVVALSSAVILALATGTFFSLYFAIAERRQAEIALARENDALTAKQQSETARAEETRARREAEAVAELLVYKDKGRFDESIDLFEETLESRRKKLGEDHPDTFTAMTNLAVVYSDAGRFDRAIQLHERMVAIQQEKHDPDHVETLRSKHALAHVLQNAGQYDQAIKLFEATRGSSSSRMECLIAAYRAAGRNRDAVTLERSVSPQREEADVPELAAQYVTKTEDFDNAVGSLAAAYLARGQFSEAGALFNQLCQTTPENPWHWYDAGFSALAAGNDEEYKRLCREVVLQFGETDDPAVAARIVYLCAPHPNAVDDTAALVRVARVAIPIWSGNERGLGFALYRAGDYSTALEQFHASAKAGFRWRAWDHAFLAMIHQQLGNERQAKIHLGVAKHESHHVADWHEIVEVQRILREAEQLLDAPSQAPINAPVDANAPTRSSSESIVELEPDHAGALNAMARILATSPLGEVRDGNGALVLATRACGMSDHRIPEYLDTLAAAYAEVGDFDSAVQSSEKSLELLGDAGSAASRESFARALSNYKAGRPTRDELPERPTLQKPQIASDAPQTPARALLGQPAPSFRTVDPDDRPIDFQDHLGKNVIMLDFWATWCGPCIKAMPIVDSVAKRFADRGLRFYAVNSQEDAETVQQFLKSNDLELPVAMDPDGVINQLYLVTGIPQTVLIGRDGKVQSVHVGYSSRLGDELGQEVGDLLAGKILARRSFGSREQSLHALATAYAAAGNWDRAIDLFKLALEAQREKAGPRHPDTPASIAALANSYNEAGREDDAIQLYEATIVEESQNFFSNHSALDFWLAELASVYRQAGRHDDAIATEERLLVALREEHNTDHTDTLASMDRLASDYLDVGRFHDAATLYEEVLAARRKNLGEDHADTISTMSNVLAALRGEGRTDEANALLQQLLVARRRIFGASEPPAHLQPPLEKLREAIDQVQTVEVEIASAASDASRLVYLNSATSMQDPDCFTANVASWQFEQLKSLGIKTSDDLVQRRIRVHGKLTDRDGWVQITVENIATQLELLTADGQWIRPQVGDKMIFAESVVPSVVQLREGIGQQATVEFRVQNVGGIEYRYLNSKINFRDPGGFTVVVEPDQVEALSDLIGADPVEELPGKLVRVTGPLQEMNAQLRIPVTVVAKQLSIVDDTDAPQQSDGALDKRR